MAVGIELARAMEPLTFFQMKVFNAQLAIRYKSATQLNTQPYCEKTRYTRIWIKLMRGGKRTRAESEAGSHRNKQPKYQWSGPESVLLMT